MEEGKYFNTKEDQQNLNCRTRAMADTDNLPIVRQATCEDDSDSESKRIRDDSFHNQSQTTDKLSGTAKETDLKKKGAIPKRKADLGDQGNKSLPGVSVSPRECHQSQTDSFNNASTGPLQLLSSSTSTSNCNPIIKTFLNDDGTEEAVDRSAIFGGKDPVGYGGPDKIRSLAERIYNMFKSTLILKMTQGSQDGVILTDMTEKLHIQQGHYREGQEYEKGEELGKGQRSTVCTISDRGKVFARKSVFWEDFNPDEAIIRCDLSHPNIPKMLGLVRTGSIVSFFFEYEPCENLQTYVDKHHLPLGQGEALDIFQEVFGTLSYLHALGIIHRDVCPSNILVKPVKLLDFGIAVKPKDSSYTEGDRNSMGHDAYRAPEIERDEPYDERVDVWSANCSLMFSLTGHAPWTGSKKDLSEADIPISTDQTVREVVEFAHQENQTRRPCSKEVWSKYESIPHLKVTELYNIPALASNPPMLSSGDSKLRGQGRER